MEDLLNKESVKRVHKFIKEFDNLLKILALDTTARTAEDAANSLKCEVGAIVKSLLLRTDNSFILCLVSGDKKCSLNKIKKILNFEPKRTVEDSVIEILEKIHNGSIDPRDSEFSNMSKLTEKGKLLLQRS